MSRPRSADPGVPITISIPSSLKTRLDQVLSWKQSRSKWVTVAITNRLDRKLPDIDELPLPTLVWTAKNHKDAPRWLIRELSYYLESTAKKQSGEIEEEQ